MPHFVVGDTFPGLDVETVAVMCPSVSKAAGRVGPRRDVQRFADVNYSMAYTGRPQSIRCLP